MIAIKNLKIKLIHTIYGQWNWWPGEQTYIKYSEKMVTTSLEGIMNSMIQSLSLVITYYISSRVKRFEIINPCWVATTRQIGHVKPGGHFGTTNLVTYLLTQVNATHLKIWPIFIYKMSYRENLDYMRGYRDNSSSSNGHQGDMPYWIGMPWQGTACWLTKLIWVTSIDWPDLVTWSTGSRPLHTVLRNHCMCMQHVQAGIAALVTLVPHTYD